MITLISGTPGSGKTALIVDMMLEELKQGGKIYTFGIPQLLLPVHEAGDIQTWQDGTRLQIDYYDPKLCKSKGIKSTWFPRGCPSNCAFLSTCPRVGALNTTLTPDGGALLIIDESHVEFPQRPSGKAPPPYIEALTVHRHPGLDFWFVSQRPSFLDPFVRGLSSRHIHLSLNSFSFTGSRNKYEWAEYQETVNRTSKMMVSKSTYKPSSAVFPLYASASVHTKLDQRMPTILKVFIFMVLILLFFVGIVVTRVQTRIEGIKQAEAGQSMPAKKITTPTPSQPADSGGAQRDTAAFGGVAIPKPEPLKISSCLSNRFKCQCYTAKGQKIPLSDADCRAFSLDVNERFKLDDQPNSFDTIAGR